MDNPTSGAGIRRRVPARLRNAAAVLLTAACVSYEPVPLDGAAVLDDVATQRATLGAEASADGVDLATATGWLREHGPAVRDVLAAFRTARARAEVPTPWPDPTLQLGPQIAWGSDVGSTRPVTPFATLSIPIPLGDRLDAQDDLNRARAEALRIGSILTLRGEYLALRGDWAALATARARETLLAELADAAGRAAAAADRLVGAGAATALDAALLELEQARAESRRFDAELQAADAAGALAARTGVATARFAVLRDAGLPELPAEPPGPDALRALVAAHRPELVDLRARYAVAERALRLEVELQYPDLQIGTTYSAEAGEQRDQFGIGFGLRLPIFDRNQQDIAAALAQRDQVRTGYETAASRALAEVETLRRRVEITAARRRSLTDAVLPRAAANEALARRAVAAGATDALRVLDVQRSLRALQVEVVDARLDEILAWIALERAVGHPLLTFPGEPPAPPAPPGDASEPTDPETFEATMNGSRHREESTR